MLSIISSMVERIDRNIGRLIDAPLLKQGKLPGDPGSNFQPGTGWAYASVTPWRLYKISQHNGGVASGGIAWWRKAGGEAGRIEPSPLHLVDVLPTFLELAQVAPPAGALAGESFVPLLHGAAWQRKGAMFFQYMDNRGIRADGWALAEVDGNAKRPPE